MCSDPPLWKPRRGRKIQNGVFGVSKAQSPGCDTSFNQQMVALEGSAAAAAMVRVRGGYTRWTPEERLLIAKACIRMGPNKAARELSRTLNKKLSKSTVQNIHKQYLERVAKRQLVNAPLSLPQGRQGQWEEDTQQPTRWFDSCLLLSLEASAALFLIFFWKERYHIYGRKFDEWGILFFMGVREQSVEDEMIWKSIVTGEGWILQLQNLKKSNIAKREGGRQRQWQRERDLGSFYMWKQE